MTPPVPGISHQRILQQIKTTAAFDLATPATRIAEIFFPIGPQNCPANEKTEFSNPVCSGCQMERGPRLWTEFHIYLNVRMLFLCHRIRDRKRHPCNNCDSGLDAGLQFSLEVFGTAERGQLKFKSEEAAQTDFRLAVKEPGTRRRPRPVRKSPGSRLGGSAETCGPGTSDVAHRWCHWAVEHKGPTSPSAMSSTSPGPPAAASSPLSQPGPTPPPKRARSLEQATPSDPDAQPHPQLHFWRIWLSIVTSPDGENATWSRQQLVQIQQKSHRRAFSTCTSCWVLGKRPRQS